MGFQAALASTLLYGSLQQRGLLSITDLTRAPAWSLSNANGSVSVGGASLPAYVLEVLEKQKLIPDPLQRFNERKLDWVRDDTWTFTRRFTLASPWAGGELVLAGVDTHRTHRFSLPADALRGNGDGQNQLSIKLKPVKSEAQKDAAAYAYAVPSTAHFGSFAEHKGFIRKAGSDFGCSDPDARPVAAGSGSYLQATHLRQLHQGAAGPVRLTAHMVVARPATGGDDAAALIVPTGSARLQIPELGVDVSQQFSGGDGAFDQGGACRRVAGDNAGARVECDIFLQVDIPKSNIELWWPAGHGPQKLYDAVATWHPAGGLGSCSDAHIINTDDPAGIEDASSLTVTAQAEAAPLALQAFGCSEAKRQVGFRTVELVTVPLAEAAKELAPGTKPATGDGTEGESMYLRVNGVPIFLKGANLIPFHAVRTQVTPEMMMSVLKSATDAHFNTLRVWGGGIYQTNAFYSACDRMGLLLWQEAMCALYPADPEFLSDVRQEIQEQVLRIGHHPSIALWGGNNENEWSLTWYDESLQNRQFYQKDYVKLYFNTVASEIVKLDPERPIVDSSPTNGPFYTGATAEGQLPTSLSKVLETKRWGDANAAKWGDVHHYDYWHDCTAPGLVPAARMMSEFGWQSEAPFFSMKAVTQPEDWGTWAPGAKYRQRWQDHGIKMKTDQMGIVFGGLPSHNFTSEVASTRAQLYSDWIYLAQVWQTVCYDHTISLARRSMHDPAKLSMGTLYWQLNDVWQGPSWSSFDYMGRWKYLHHALERTYAPLQLQAFVRPEDDTAAVLLAYDEAKPLPGTVAVDIYLQALSAGGAGASGGDATADAAPTCLGGAAARAGSRRLVGSFEIEAGSLIGAEPAWKMSMEELLAKLPGCSRTSCYLRAVAREVEGGAKEAGRRGGAKGMLLGAAGEDNAGQVQEAVAFFSKLNALNLPEVSVRPHSFTQTGPKTVDFKITASGGTAVHAFWDASPVGRFSINAVPALQPCKTVALRFEAVEEVKASDLADSLTVWTMNGALQGKQRPALGAI
ncbi:mannosidase, beta A, lysosomal [Monoraphidium neglectum]|uniref:beta-mannosidase n=1 Tax=Monoraphidium neglectum TaxID=145388 RepID=A0A0D2N5U1_9CHLO|nr:mannosidase, beta A, lysosomal [Monoraphidium neglectum]KIZ07627.1 mannosidase, beta A, lysosomal [Monoraphidium neglectum]|eukprot:XP_013906646.1 mannosidase, beta A, lysosomal [Monoraphidium neglectum]